MGAVESATKYGHLALQILEQYPSSIELACRTLTVWIDSMPHKIPYRKCLEPLKESHELGLVTGDIHTAMVVGFVYDALKLFVGDPLPSVLASVMKTRRLCNEYQHTTMIDFLDVLAQTISNFQKSTGRDPLILTGATMNEEEMMKKISADNGVGLLWTLIMKFMLATYLHNFDYAQSLSHKIRPIYLTLLPLVDIIYRFLEGVVAAANGKKSRQNRTTARNRLKKIKQAAKNCPENLSNKVCLLEAEIARFSDKHEKALAKYDEAIALAAKDLCLHEQGFAAERAGRMLLEFGQTNKAMKYLTSARALYGQWGSSTKVEQMDHILYKKSSS